MTDPIEDRTMILYGLSKRTFATKEIAEKIAEMVIANIFGEEELELQIPLQTKDLVDRWMIEGSRSYDFDHPIDQMMNGRVIIEILKRNCQIVKFTQLTALVDPDPPA